MPAAFSEIKDAVLDRLKGLDDHLTYHNVNHTLDVLAQSIRIAGAEKLNSDEDVFLLKVAALYHDTGFLKAYRGHEKMSCEIFLEDADRFGFSQSQKELVQGMIMATQVPQKPVGILQEIICDADLDYLAREDFYQSSDNLRKEFLHYHIVEDNDQWEDLQLKFFENHRYHTSTSKKQREPARQKHFAELLAHP
ncbi:MAG: HD domain-containing protein [Bacteroidetes bacterium]|nr:HD domain-containing protein [Bacteroidota bacterium]